MGLVYETCFQAGDRMRTYYAVLRKGDDVLSTHTVQINKDHRTVYQSISSLDAFNRAAKGDYTCRLMVESEFQHSFDTDQRLWHPEMSPQAKSPRYVHRTLWAFYAAIGWNYRAKQFGETVNSSVQ